MIADSHQSSAARSVPVTVLGKSAFVLMLQSLGITILPSESTTEKKTAFELIRTL